MHDSVLIESQYLPPIEFFCLIKQYESLHLEVHENFQKQTYRNRCYILGANNVQCLTIPVVKANSKQSIGDLKIDYSRPWHKEHWRSIKSAYGKSPFFEFFEPHFENPYLNPPEKLLDFNGQLLTICLKLLGLKSRIIPTSEYLKSPKKGILDARSLINPKVDFKKRSIYMPEKYLQVFGKDFVPNLSVIDLLMNEGPNSLNLVTKSIRTE
ncbi:WbqC family protein [Fulvivirga lutea]|uniref:WbqC family protein n=2 Tax=Fulvivirga lutea TaxID=2810512 RepID=A0A974WJE5_9BACT|nr:WbqC family protein [Fulvivirga lutea]